MGIKLLLVDDHRIMIDGLRLIIEREPDMAVVGEAHDGPTAAEAARNARPDVVLMDLAMPETNGVETIRRILEAGTCINILVLCRHRDKEKMAEALKAGARGFLLKECSSAELIDAIRTVVLGEVYICKRITGMLFREYINSNDKETPIPAPLTPREREILKFIAEGMNTKEIAFTIHVSVKTVESFRRLIMKKLNLQNVVELTKYAIREGIVSIN